MIPAHLDHIIFAAPELEQGMDVIESILDTRPVIGGRHPNFGTHNALLSIGDNIYLEVIAPDPDLEIPPHGLFLEEAFQKPPHLATWVIRSYNIEETLSGIDNTIVQMGALQSGSRMTPDGQKVEWKLSDPYVLPMGGAIPFIIDWGSTPHPSSSLPNAGHLIGLSLDHPDPSTVDRVLRHLGTAIDIKQSSDFRLTAFLEKDGNTITMC